MFSRTSLPITISDKYYHALPVLHVLRPVLVLPAEQGGEGHDDGHDPDEGDQHPDGG